MYNKNRMMMYNSTYLLVDNVATFLITFSDIIVSDTFKYFDTLYQKKSSHVIW